MDRIPDVDDGMEESYDSRLTEPEVGSEIIPDDSAMDSHGMLEHGEEEPPFDPSILDDPDLQELPEDTVGAGTAERTRSRNRNTGTATVILTPQRMPPPRNRKASWSSAPRQKGTS